MRPLYQDLRFTFRFAYPDTGERLGLLAMALVGEGGWVDLHEPIIVQAGDAFIFVPKPEARTMTTDPFEIAAEDATSADAAGLIAGLSEELAHRYDHTEDGSGHFRPEDVAVPRSVFLVGRLVGLPVACGALRPLEGDVGEVKRMYVKPGVRGQGLSKRLLAALEDAARRMGYVALRLETGDRQPEAIRLYESAGYQRTDPFGIYIDNPHSVCFEKRLV